MYDARHDLDLTDGPWPAAVIRDLPVGLLEMDAGGRVVRVNTALLRLLAPAVTAELSTAGGPRAVEGRLVTESWPRLAEVAVAVLSGRPVDGLLRMPHLDLRVNGVPRRLGSRPHGGLLVVSQVADRAVVDLRDEPSPTSSTPSAGLSSGPSPGPTPSLDPAVPGPADGSARQPASTWRRMTGGRRRAAAGRSDEHAATHDLVTGLPNQVLLLQCLGDALAACRPGLRVAVFAVQVSGGHPGEADELCRHLADRLAHLVGPSDVAARLEGTPTRFAVVLRDVRPGADVERFVVRAERRLWGDLTRGDAVRAGSGVDGLGVVLADPTTGDRDARAVLTLALEALERSRTSGRPVVGAEPPVQAELARLEALAAYDLYDGDLDDALQGVAQVARATCEAEGALVTFVDKDLQWVRAASGEDVVTYVDGRAPRHLTLCDRTIRGREVVVVPDTGADPSFQVSRHVAWQVGMRFYAGAPLVTDEGRAVGTLCVLDRHPRTVSARQRRSLVVLAAETVALLEAHRIG